MAQLGINLVRFHHMDNSDIWESNEESKLSETQLDKLHYFLYCLCENGIYANINLHVSRDYPEPELKSLLDIFSHGKPLDRFYPSLIQYQLDYARDLLKSYNNYTGYYIGEDPMILNIELSNENSMFDLIEDDYIDALSDTVFETELLSQWHRWLRTRYNESFLLLNETWNSLYIDRSINLIQNCTHQYQRDDNTISTYNSATDTHTIEVKEIPEYEWDNQIQFMYINDFIEPLTEYTIELEASGNPENESEEMIVSFNFQQQGEPYTLFNYGNIEIKLTKDIQKYNVPISTISNVETPNNIYFKIICYPFIGTYTFRNIKIYKGTEANKIQFDNDSFESIGIPRKNWVKPSQSDYRIFIRDTEENTQRNITNYIKNVLGFNEILIVDSQCTYGTFLSYTREYENSDIIDIHRYWDGPYFDEGQYYNMSNYWLDNTPMLNSETYGTMSEILQYKGANKPYTISEYNYPFPSEYLHEKYFILGPLTAFYDCDAVYQYVYDQNGFSETTKGFIRHFFEMTSNPLDFSIAPFFTLAFRKGYVSISKETLNIKIPKNEVENINGKTEDIFDVIIENSPIEVGYPAKIELEIGDTNSGKIEYNFNGGEINISNEGCFITEEFIWKNERCFPNEKPLFKVNTSKYKTLTGSIGNNEMSIISDLEIIKLNIKLNEEMKETGSVGIVTLDDKNLTESTKILLVIAGKIKNSEQKWNSDRTSTGRTDEGGFWGNSPVQAQYIEFTGTLLIEDEIKPKIWTINQWGEKNQTLQVLGTKGSYTFKSDENNPSISFLIERTFPSTNTYSQSDTYAQSDTYSQSNTFTKSNYVTKQTETSPIYTTLSNTYTLTYSFSVTQTETYQITITNTLAFTYINSTYSYVPTIFIFYEYTMIAYTTYYSYYSNFIQNNEPTNDSNTTLIIVICVVVVVIIIIVLLIVLFIRIRNKKQNETFEESQNQETDVITSDIKL
ncbi:cellulase family glycosylhydrolase [Histomonas meleagridis]|uniref:cellulase family glycosylhydrolase n=1 Tax=Histomonas meleagridis TaxID=135588 RepID=UPI00355A6260|nr:cellulase family glycosylhydrolase [Histomonas meleagridis]